MKLIAFLSWLIVNTAGYSVCPFHVECIPGCLKLDERGCKMCACGPMMFHPGAGYRGMPGGIMGGASFTPGTLGGGSLFGSVQGGSSGGYHAVKEKPLKECTGTMLCIMTCKEHYSLSKDVQRNGCRSCTCPKTQTHTQVQIVVEKPQPKPQPKPEPKPQTVQQVVYVQKPVTHTDCTGTKLCMMTCKGKYILGEHGKDGCQSCACVPEPEPVIVQPVEKKECHETVMCMLSCKHGYSLSPKCNDGCHDECQKCTCIEPTPAPVILQTHKVECPKTLECMLQCKNGYHLGSAGPDGCPECSCLAPKPVVKVIYEVKCAQALTCPRGCSVGYRCDNDGCPTCECIEPQVVGVLTVHEVHTTQQLSCKTALTCPKSCSLGYKCGDDGCPTCECLVEVHTVSNVKPMLVQPTKAPVAPAVSTMVSKCPVTIQCMSTCEHGYTLGSEGRDGCPSCVCINPKTSECHDVCEHKPAIAVHTCDATLQCMASCTDGYDLHETGNDGCPGCTCKQVQCHTGCEETHHQVIQLVQTTSECTTGTCEHKCTDDCDHSSGQIMQLVSGGKTSVSSGSGMRPFGGGAMGGGAIGGGTIGGGAVGGGASGGGGSMRVSVEGEECPALPPNCHPYCIKYDVAHCRRCDCESSGTNGYSG